MTADIALHETRHPPRQRRPAPDKTVRLETITLSDDDMRLTMVFKALANPIRLAILRWLVEHPQCITGDVVEVAGLAQSTVSGHLAVLRECGLICGTIEGPATCYCVNLEAVDWLEAQVGRVVRGVRETAAQCCVTP